MVLNSGVTDYVNASKVNVRLCDERKMNILNTILTCTFKGYKHCNAFLAAQSPLEDTVADFWQMVWEAQSRVIVMLCNIEEDGKVRFIQEIKNQLNDDDIVVYFRRHVISTGLAMLEEHNSLAQLLSN